MIMLVVLSFLVVILLFVIAVLLFTPISLKFSSQCNELELALKGLVYGKLYLSEHSIWVSIKVPFYYKKFDLLEKLLEPSKSSPDKTKVKYRKGLPGKATRRIKSRLKRILSTFQIKRFYLNIDFGNNLITGIFYPIFFLAGLNGWDVYTNFTGKREISIEVENKLIRVARVLFF